MKKLKPTAFHRWLIQITGGNIKLLTEVLKYEILNNQNPQAFDLLKATGDKNYTPETFVKASEFVKAICV